MLGNDQIPWRSKVAHQLSRTSLTTRAWQIEFGWSKNKVNVKPQYIWFNVTLRWKWYHLGSLGLSWVFTASFSPDDHFDAVHDITTSAPDKDDWKLLIEAPDEDLRKGYTFLCTLIVRKMWWRNFSKIFTVRLPSNCWLAMSVDTSQPKSHLWLTCT